MKVSRSRIGYRDRGLQRWLETLRVRLVENLLRLELLWLVNYRDRGL